MFGSDSLRKRVFKMNVGDSIGGGLVAGVAARRFVRSSAKRAADIGDDAGLDIYRILK
jgi:hypothetical protein